MNILTLEAQCRDLAIADESGRRIERLKAEVERLRSERKELVYEAADEMERLQAKVAAERERCAKIAFDLLVSADEQPLACRALAAIRKGE